MSITMVPVTSDDEISAAGYDADTSTLRLQFHSGAVYEYPGVPGSYYTAIVGGSSLAASFSQTLRTQYGGTLVTAPPENYESS